MTERVGFSVSRIATIAVNTFTEAVRQKVFNILLLFALVVIGSASFFSQFTFSEQLKFVKDFCLGAISIFGTLIAIVGTAQLLPAEMESRTLYTILAKPVRRAEFLLGKYAGSILLIFLSVVVMSLMFVAALWYKENQLVRDTRQDPTLTVEEKAAMESRIYEEARDFDLAKGVVLLFFKQCLLAALTLLFSTVSHSMVFNVTMGFMAFFAGHLREAATEVLWEGWVAKWLLTIVPDLAAFNVADEVIVGQNIPWLLVGQVTGYGLVYTAVVLLIAYLMFSEREV
ncbi:MAG: ABC transporter permease subunit [Verrucomicrobiae bacterium]|nr:ABC transporter permease subunit [Verrucomicrobiae bacterium]